MKMTLIDCNHSILDQGTHFTRQSDEDKNSYVVSSFRETVKGVKHFYKIYGLNTTYWKETKQYVFRLVIRNIYGGIEDSYIGKLDGAIGTMKPDLEATYEVLVKAKKERHQFVAVVLDFKHGVNWLKKPTIKQVPSDYEDVVEQIWKFAEENFKDVIFLHSYRSCHQAAHYLYKYPILGLFSKGEDIVRVGTDVPAIVKKAAELDNNEHKFVQIVKVDK